MSDVDDQDLTIKVLRERCQELEQKLDVVAHERALALVEVKNLTAQNRELNATIAEAQKMIAELRVHCDQLGADIRAIYDAQNG